MNSSFISSPFYSRVGRFLAVLVAGLIGLAFGVTRTDAQPASPTPAFWTAPLPPQTLPWEYAGTSTVANSGLQRRTMADAGASNMQTVSALDGSIYSLFADNPDVDPAVRNLAQNLNGDPIKVYEWVRNNVRTEFYYGCRRGAALTLLERAGNDVDQCALLGALLRVCGYTPKYYSGKITVPLNAPGPNSVGIYQWLPLAYSAASARSMLSSHSPDPIADISQNHLTFAYMWVGVTLPGRGPTTFVPALKPYSAGRRPSISSLSGFSLSAALAAAGGSVTTPSFSTAINPQALRDYLNARAVQASDAIKASPDLHDLSGAELAGLPRIVPEFISFSPVSYTSFPQSVQLGSAQPFDGIPLTYVGNLHIVYGGGGWFDVRIESASLLGLPLTLAFVGADNTPVLTLNGLELARASYGNGPNHFFELKIEYEMPQAYNGGIARVNYGAFSTSSGPVAILYSYGRSLGRLRRTLSEVVAAGNAATSTDFLHLMTQQYMSQECELGSAACAALGQTYERSILLGTAFLQNGKPVLDLQANYTAFSGDATTGGRAALWLFDSALEGTVAEQLTGARSFGTATLFDHASRAAYLLDRTNYSASVGSLANFASLFGSAEVAGIANYLQQDARNKLLVLADSKVFHGSAFYGGYYLINTYSGSVASLIAGSNGGIAGAPLGTPTVAPLLTNAPTYGTVTTATVATPTSSDPVDLTSGAFIKHDTDLVLGNESAPNGLSLERSYNSLRTSSDPVGLGRGWTHNFDMRFALRTPIDIDAENAYVDEIIPVILAVRAAEAALFTGSPGLYGNISYGEQARGWLVASTAVTWAADRQINSRASVVLGSRTAEFVQRPDGSYAAPGKLTATLTQGLGGSFYDLAFRHGNTIRFRAEDGKFVSIKDQFGKALTATYSGSRLDKVADSYNRYFSFTYNGSNRLTGVSDSTGRSVSYGRDASSNFTFTDAESKTQTLEMDANFLLTRIKDGRGRIVVENDYDLWHRVYQQRMFGEPGRTISIGIAPGVGLEKDPLGGMVWTYLDARGRQMAAADQNAKLSRWEYDGADRLRSTTTSLGHERDFTYDAFHVLTSETNEAGHTRFITPDANHRPWKIQNFEGKETVVTYTAEHRVETITAPGGLVSNFSYDTRGRLFKAHPAAYAGVEVDEYLYDDFGGLDRIIRPGSGEDIFLFDARGNCTEVVDRRNVKTSFAYNARRQGTKVSRWDGATEHSTQAFYDAAGDVDYTLDASGRRTTLEHDALGHLTKVKQGPVGSQITVLTNSYTDPRNLVTTATDALGNVTTYTYYATQLPATVKDPLYRISTVGYDDDQRLVAARSPLGTAALNKTPSDATYASSNTLDMRSWLDGETDAENRFVDYTYDKDGRALALGNRLNKTFSWIYDDAARTIVSRTPLLKTTTATFNTRGLLSSVVEPSTQSTTFNEYDAEGRLTQSTDATGVTSYTYWGNGLPKHVTEDGKTTYREYDNLNRLSRYEDGEGNAIGYKYHPSGEISEITYPGNKVVAYDYDNFGRLWHVTDWSNRKTTYSYDNASRLERIDRPNGTYRKQNYDAASQLISIEEYTSGNVLFYYQDMRYDDDGRLTYQFRHPKAPATVLPHDNLFYDDDNQLSHWNSATANITFDPDGNMTFGPLPNGSLGTYVYNSRNQLISAGGSGYRYNADGLRVEIIGADAATFFMDPNAALSRMLIRRKGGITTYYVYGLGLINEETNGAPKYYHFDQVGSTIAVTDGSQAVTDRFSYTPFGAMMRVAGVTDTPFQFNGALGVQTDITGLYYMRARYYNPRVMRFINADPIGFGGGMNWYAFCGNNPLGFVDPTGLEREARAQDRAWAYGHMKKLFSEVPDKIWSPSQGYFLMLDFRSLYSDVKKDPVGSVEDGAMMVFFHKLSGGSVRGSIASAAESVRYAGFRTSEFFSSSYRSLRIGWSGGGRVRLSSPTAGALFPRPRPFRQILTPGEQAEFEDLRTKYPDWMPSAGLDTPANVRSALETANARAEFVGKGHHPHPLKFDGDPNPTDLVHTGETRTMKNPIHTEISNFWERVRRRIGY